MTFFDSATIKILARSSITLKAGQRRARRTKDSQPARITGLSLTARADHKLRGADNILKTRKKTIRNGIKRTRDSKNRPKYRQPAARKPGKETLSTGLII